jgi:23S rRNA (adenine2030-N6)-methyltransferase
MLSYRHSYHAGNHADVLKHTVLIHCLEYMNGKDKPYSLIDTHAGAGIYSLETDHAERTGEYKNGVGRLWSRKDLPEALRTYLATIRKLNLGEKLRRYPGSPWLMSNIARDGDRLRFCEMHSTDSALLRREFKGQAPRVVVEQCDGFDALRAALPPISRRGIVLIDPSYEMNNDYARVVAAVKDALKRFATGTVLVWHPCIASLDAKQLPERLKKAGATSWLHAQLSVVAPAPQGRGMHGSGMFIINPPWTLEAKLREALPYLAEHLAMDERAAWSLDCFEQGAAAKA